ncbi:GNAT family N-acetyltransferase [Candidatus Micrarchaeota archaeon]|nr:GNAT family N-acetyltransferase [Candidatus Micrarchaeota archaeon]
MINTKFKLKNGKELEPIHLHPGIPVDALLDYINSIIREDAYLHMDTEMTAEEERNWLISSMNDIYHDRLIHYVVFDENKIIAGATAKKGNWREAGNVQLGIAIRKECRSLGLGEKLLSFLIEKTKEKWNPRNIYLYCAEENKPALSLYKKIGFEEFAKFPEWFKYQNKYLDVIYLILSE